MTGSVSRVNLALDVTHRRYVMERRGGEVLYLVFVPLSLPPPKSPGIE